jgi:hypothetical protein
MRKIFISYRRSEAEYAAGALGRELRRRFGDEQVFRDKEDIGGGATWKQLLLHEIDRDSALLVLMGKGWADVRDSQGRGRLDSASGDPPRLAPRQRPRDGHPGVRNNIRGYSPYVSRALLQRSGGVDSTCGLDRPLPDGRTSPVDRTVRRRL